MIYWIIIFFILSLVVCGTVFYKRYKAHQMVCQRIRQSLYEPMEKKDHDYSIYFPAALMTGEYLWQIYTIDSSIIKAVDFSSTENLDSSYAVANYLMTNMLEHDEQSYAGFRNRLIGYIGEQKVADVLAEQGQNAVWASTSNQELWDLQIDDQLINVKTILDVNSIRNTAIAHPDVMYLVPEDTYKNIGIDNIQPLNGFNYQEINETLDSTYEQIDGTSAFDTFNSHLPIGSSLVALNERNRLIKAGGDQQAVNKNVLIDFALKTTGSLTMAKIGGIIGAGLGSLVFMPIAGGVLGAALGAFWGAKTGKEFGEKIKELELQKQKLKLNILLEKFGEKYFIYLSKIKSQFFLKTEKYQNALDSFEKKFQEDSATQSWKNIFFEDKNTIFYQELKKIGERAYENEKTKAEQRAAIFNEIENTHNSKALALILINNVHLRDFLYIDLIELKKIYAQKNRTYLERYKLYPDKFPLTNELKNHKKIYGDYVKKTA